MVNPILITSGMALIAVALAPTPDDITIVLPVVQFGVGAALVYKGFTSKE